MNRLPAAQYGLLVDTGRVELSFYATAGTHSRRLSDPRGETLEVKGRYKKPSGVDFACLLRSQKKTDYQALFIRYTDWELGLGACLSGTDYAYLQQIMALTWEIRLDGDLHLFAPLGKDGAHLRENEYCFTGELRAPLGGKWAFLSRLVLAETDYTPTPRIYRGFPAGDPPKYQAALEVLYDHRFSYSKEVLGFIQWTGVEFFQFLEGEGIKDFSLATGCGFRAAYRIIGLSRYIWGLSIL